MSNKRPFVYLSLLAIAILAVALCVAGCSSSSTNAPSASPTAQASPTAPATVTGAPTQAATGSFSYDNASLDPWKKAFKFDQLHWYTYQARNGGEIRVEYAAATYQGQPAAKVTTYTTKNGTRNKTAEFYYDFAAQKFLSGTLYSGEEGFPMQSADDLSATSDVYFSYDNPDAFPAGTVPVAESLTTVKGTFTCNKYTSTDGTITYWVSADAPMPLKLTKPPSNNGVWTSPGVDWAPTSWG